MKFRNLAVAAAVLILVFGFLYFYEIKGKKEKEKEARIESQLYSYDPTTIARMDILADGKSIQIIKRDKEWLITKPIEEIGDPRVIENILLALKQTQVTSSLEAADKLKEYNLSPAPVLIELTTVSGNKLPSLWIGDETPLGEEYFAMQEGKKTVLVLSKEIAPLREMTLYSLRDKKLLPYSRWDISELLLESNEHRIRFKRSADLWDMTEPIGCPADETSVSALLSALENTEIKKFIDDETLPFSEFALDKPLLSISCRREGDQGWYTLSFGKEQEGALYAKRSDRKALFMVEKASLAPAMSDAKEFMDPRVSRRNRYSVQEFEVSAGERALQAKMNAAKEWVSSVSGQALDKGNVYLLLSALMESRASDLIKRNQDSEKQCGLTKPLITATIKGKDFSEEMSYSMGASGEYFALNSSTHPIIYKISQADFRRIEESLSKSLR